MEEVEVFFIANLNIVDKETYRKYEQGFFPILKKHGGEFITYDDSSEHLEGNNPLRGRIVIFKFPSVNPNSFSKSNGEIILVYLIMDLISGITFSKVFKTFMFNWSLTVSDHSEFLKWYGAYCTVVERTCSPLGAKSGFSNEGRVFHW